MKSINPGSPNGAVDIWTGCISKAGLSYLFQNGNFGTWQGKNNRQGRKPIENSIAAGKNLDFQPNQILNSKFKTFFSRFFRWDPYSNVAADQSVCLEWDLASRLSNQNSAEWGGNGGDRRPVISHFGAHYE
ncbi:hypothetical protein AVEN_21618-1 [Araneus ventricosus]|uniref:Uncharacterized protein n=1 Tax=Araneus ventricosus TaxID=182803 RepID=A0A4Y2GA43_ARAVE|nr:hypothetical protein AVEN_21618-1 [Araneus ventricosus]